MIAYSKGRDNLKKNKKFYGGNMVKCSRCGKDYKESKNFGASGEIRVAICRACPVDNVFAVCERCDDFGKIELDPCPNCGVWNMWEFQKMVPVED
jgi:DnaJ-class molecular chaperone